MQAAGCYAQHCLQPSLQYQLPPYFPHPLALRQSSSNSAQSIATADGGAAEMMDTNDASNHIDTEAAAAAAAVDRAKVASMLDALALQQPLFMSSKYVKIADLNRGASGFVQLAQNQENWERVAIKFIPRGEHSKEVLCRELLHLSECGQHPNIVQLKEVFLTPHHLGIAMEYVDGGDLAAWVQMNRIPDRGLPERDARWLFQQIALAVDFCHRLGIALRDIKLDNCLIDATRGAPLVKLCDFGYSKAENLGSGCKTACGTPEYMAPEVLTEAKYKGNAADVWSLGVMLYVMIEGAFPFRLQRQRYQMQKMIGRIVKADYKRPTHASPACQNLLQQMLLPSPEQRITIAGILKHPWFLRDLPPGTEQVNERLQHDIHARVSEQTRNEIRHVVDLCNAHAPIAQCRTARPLTQQADPHSQIQQENQQPGDMDQQQVPQQPHHQQPQQRRQDHSADMQRLLAFGQHQDNPLRMTSI